MFLFYGSKSVAAGHLRLNRVNPEVVGNQFLMKSSNRISAGCLVQGLTGIGLSESKPVELSS